jgi:hypothetical protein
MNSSFVCKRCDFLTNDKKDFRRHCNTLKHKKLKLSCIRCLKEYKFASGLSRHKCKGMNTKDKKLVADKHDDKKLNQLITIIKQQQQQLNKSQELMEKVIQENIDIIPRIGNNISINVYLNEKCKNAMNLNDFVENLNISLEDLMYTQRHGYVEGVTNIFTKQLKGLQPSERPIHCSDKKRLHFYVKDDNIWKKDEEHEKIEKSIHEIKIKQMKKLKKWEDKNPLFLSDNDLQNQWQKMVKSILGPVEDSKTMDKDMSFIKKTLASKIPVKFALKNM